MIPAYNEELYLGPCLQSLASQDFPGPVEVIVVDNNSTDRTDARRRIGRCEGGGRGSARRWYYLLGYWTNRLLHRQVLGLAPALGLTELPVERRPWRRAAIGTIAVLASFLMIGWVEFRVHRT